MTKPKEPVFGIAMRNFTRFPEMPSAAELIDYGVRMEELGYESVWAWDHILLGVEPSFPIHEALMKAISGFGEFEIAPKKGYLSLRRKKQFAMIGPGTKTRVDVGLNMKGVPATERLLELPPGGMCQYKVNVAEAREVDAELIGWIRQAYDSAG